MHWRKRFLLILLLFFGSLIGLVGSHILMTPPEAQARTRVVQALLRPAPTQPVGYFDLFGELLTPKEAAYLVKEQGLDMFDPASYEKIGAVRITQDLINEGGDIFFNRKLGDTFGIQRVFGFGEGFDLILPDILTAIDDLQGQPTTNLSITLSRSITLGNRSLDKGETVRTGFDVVSGNPDLPLGLINPDRVDSTCAVCHVTLSDQGSLLPGVPNGDLNIPLLIALAPNSAAGFSRLNINPLDPIYQGDGKTIIDSKGNTVELPDPVKLERAFDDLVLSVPVGNFESSTDGINNTVQIPSVFTFKGNPYGADGQLAVGPFAGLSAFNSAVHSSEINILGNWELIAKSLGIDPEVYLGVVLQNASDPDIRLPDDKTVKPSKWLREVAPDPKQAELDDQIAAPEAGAFPNLSPSLFTFNGLIFSPDTERFGDEENDVIDIASGKFLFANNAMAAWQNSLVPPPNRTLDNQEALRNGSVLRGAKVFKKANCISCHIPPFFTDNIIHPNSEIGANPARAESRLGIEKFLTSPKMYALNTRVPPPFDAKVLDIPTEGISNTPTTLPNGLSPDGGYKTPSLRGLYLSAPYLHDGGVAVREGALQFTSDGGFDIVDPTRLGLPGTLSQGEAADPASSLRALIDRDLRSQVIAINRNPMLPDPNFPLLNNNLDGTGHDFYVDDKSWPPFSPADQSDLVNFLMALDDDPGRFEGGDSEG
ncbi:MAG: hypothetical protein QNJ46_32550 [Leptolyngbyaceae cyanobacterium MO_188.B28]|nr:hypothetical protein [Leptolyngbyaceae cyanobacterium MO_188.B28]